MDHLNFSVQNVVDGNALQISITGMAIVFAGLASISLFIALLPKILKALHREGKKEEASAPVNATSLEKLDEDSMIAVVYVVHMEYERLTGDDVKADISQDSESAWALSSKMRTFPARG